MNKNQIDKEQYKIVVDFDLIYEYADRGPMFYLTEYLSQWISLYRNALWLNPRNAFCRFILIQLLWLSRVLEFINCEQRQREAGCRLK